MLPSEVFFVAAAYGHLEPAVGGGVGMAGPFGSERIVEGIFITWFCERKMKNNYQNNAKCGHMDAEKKTYILPTTQEDLIQKFLFEKRGT